MTFLINGADRRTGEDKQVEVIAETKDEALKQVANTLFVSKIETKPTPQPTLIVRKTPPSPPSPRSEMDALTAIEHALPEIEYQLKKIRFWITFIGMIILIPIVVSTILFLFGMLGLLFDRK